MTDINQELLESHQKVCDGRYFTWKAWNAVCWAVAVVVLGILTASTTWAISTSASLTRAQTQIERAQEDIKAAQETYGQIDKKLDRLLAAKGER